MKTIYKYQLDSLYVTMLELPAGAHVMHFAEQGGVFNIWAMVDTDASKETRYFTIVGTGWEIDGDECYIGTVHVGAFVWHCLEIKP